MLFIVARVRIVASDVQRLLVNGNYLGMIEDFCLVVKNSFDLEQFIHHIIGFGLLDFESNGEHRVCHAFHYYCKTPLELSN